MRVSVIGASTVEDPNRERAYELGRLLGERGHTVVCGGLGGVMDAVCAGAHETGATTVGILPGADPAAANDHVDVPIATGLGHARNALVPLNGDAVVAVEGGPGTLSELAFALVYGRPVVGIDTHDVAGVDHVEDAAAAEAAVEHAVGSA